MENKKEIQTQNQPSITEIEKTVIDYLDAFGITKQLSEKEKILCIEIAKAFQLNPFKREIHFIPYKDKDGERNINIIVGYETYLKRAERSGKLAGWRVWTEGTLQNRDLKAICEIHRKDWNSPLQHEVYFIEYVRPTKIWQEKPYTMIKKIAIAQAFRLAFPDELGGIPYTAEEQWEAEVIENENVKIEQAKPVFAEIATEEKAGEKEEQKKEEQDRKEIRKSCAIIKAVDPGNLTECEVLKKRKKDGNEYIEVNIKSPEMKLFCFDTELFHFLVEPKTKIDIYYAEEERKGKTWKIIKDIEENIPF